MLGLPPLGVRRAVMRPGGGAGTGGAARPPGWAALGIQRRALCQEGMVNPPPAERVQSGDRLIALAEDEADLVRLVRRSRKVLAKEEARLKAKASGG